MSVDKVRAKAIQDELARLEDAHNRVSEQIRELNGKIKSSEHELEAKRQAGKAINQRLNYKKTLLAKVQSREREKNNFVEHNPGVDVDDIRRRVGAHKAKIAKDMVKLNAEIGKLVMDGVKRKMNSAVLKFKLMPVLDQLDVLRR